VASLHASGDIIVGSVRSELRCQRQARPQAEGGNRVECYICVTCGVQFAPSREPPASCPICLDERQYIGHDGQRWTTLAELTDTHEARVEEIEPGLFGIGVEPAFAIGQRALLVKGVLWDCVPPLGDGIEQAVSAAGGIEAIAISHPHFYSVMVEWAERFDVRILLHEADRMFVMRPSPRIEYWRGEHYRVSDEIELFRLGGHFPGGTVGYWRGGAGGRGAVLSGDIIQVAEDRDWVSFMWSYPNLIPLPAGEIARIRGVVASLDFDRLYGAWWERIITGDARAKVLRSADRYIDALGGAIVRDGE
jgi:hypothetical protein